MILAVFVIFNVSIYRQVENLARKHHADMTRTIESELEQIITNVRKMAADYAFFDDTLRFAGDGNKTYIHANLPDQSILNLEMDAVCILNSAGKPIYIKAPGLPEKEESDFCAAIISLLQSHPELCQQTALAERGGLIAIGRQLSIMGVCPISDSARKAPAKGTFIFVRNISDNTLKKLRHGKDLLVELMPMAQASEQSRVNISPLPTPENRLLLFDVTSERMKSRLLLDDLLGHPTFVFSVEAPAAFRSEMRRLFWSMVAAVFVLGLATTLVAVLSVQKPVTESEHALQRKEEELIQAQKMEAVGRLAGGLAHDFNNILVVITGYVDLLMCHFSHGAPEYRHLEEIQKAGKRAHDLTRGLLLFSRKQVTQPEHIDLNQLLDDAEPMIQRLITEDIKLVKHYASNPGFVFIDSNQMQQVIMNLAVNARDAMSAKGGTLTITTSSLTVKQGDRPFGGKLEHGNYVTLTISDTGCGMSQSIQSHLFEPFFTTKEAGRGTGLGLSTVYGIVTHNDGRVFVQSEVDKGSSFTIVLPRSAASLPSSPEQPQEENTPVGGTETVFLVEDEAQVRMLVRQTLETRGYRVIEAANAQEALRLFKEKHPDFDLLLSDVVMPGIKGEELASYFQTLLPEVAVLLMSGYTDERVTSESILQQGYGFIQKPFSPKELLAKVREVIDRSKGSV